MMVIGLDFDETYTADPEFWDDFIALAEARGHLVFIATARHNDDCAEIKQAGLTNEVVCSGGKAKMQAFVDQGVPVPNIWIDDMPHIIFSDP